MAQRRRCRRATHRFDQIDDFRAPIDDAHNGAVTVVAADIAPLPAITVARTGQVFSAQLASTTA